MAFLAMHVILIFACIVLMLFLLTRSLDPDNILEFLLLFQDG